MKTNEGLYPIIRRARRPLVPTDTATAATTAVPAQPPAPMTKPPKPEVKKDAGAPAAND
ncbi:MAG: hypothetical protein ACXWJX_08605 [Limisphaerales bacterium]